MINCLFLWMPCFSPCLLGPSKIRKEEGAMERRGPYRTSVHSCCSSAPTSLARIGPCRLSPHYQVLTLNQSRETSIAVSPLFQREVIVSGHMIPMRSSSQLFLELPRGLLEVQRLRLHPRHLDQNLHFEKIPRWFLCTLKFEEHGGPSLHGRSMAFAQVQVSGTSPIHQDLHGKPFHNLSSSQS